MRSWRLPESETPDGSRSPVVLHSSDEGRVVLIGLLPGQELGDHQVKEHVFLVVVDGTARIEAGGEKLEAGAGTMVAFDPDERRVVASDSGAKILLMLSPWPGVGHYRGDVPAGGS